MMIAPQSYDHILLVCGRKTFDSDRNESFANYKDLISLIDADEMLKSSDLGPNLQSIHNSIVKANKEMQIADFQNYFEEMIKILNRSAAQLLFDNEVEKTLEIVKKCELLLENKKLGYYPKSKVLTLNTHACYYRRIKEIANALNCLDDALQLLDQNQLLDYRGITCLNMGALFSQIDDHEAAFENASLAVISFYEQYIGFAQENNRSFLQTDQDFLDIATLLSTALYNLGMEEEFYQNLEKAEFYFHQALQVAKDNFGNGADITQQMQTGLNKFQNKNKIVDEERKKRAIKWNPNLMNYRDKCLSCSYYSKKGFSMEERLKELQYYYQLEQQGLQGQMFEYAAQNQYNYCSSSDGQNEQQSTTTENEIQQQQQQDEGNELEEHNLQIDTNCIINMNNGPDSQQHGNGNVNVNGKGGFHMSPLKAWKFQHFSPNVQNYIYMYPESTRDSKRSRKQTFQQQEKHRSFQQAAEDEHNEDNDNQQQQIQQNPQVQNGRYNAKQIQHSHSKSQSNLPSLQQSQCVTPHTPSTTVNPLYSSTVSSRKNNWQRSANCPNSIDSDQLIGNVNNNYFNNNVNDNNCLPQNHRMSQHSSSSSVRQYQQYQPQLSNRGNNFVSNQGSLPPNNKEVFGLNRITSNAKQLLHKKLKLTGSESSSMAHQFKLNYYDVKRRQTKQGPPPDASKVFKKKMDLNSLKNSSKGFSDKASLMTGACDCQLCRRVFGLPKNFITVYPYRNAILPCRRNPGKMRAGKLCAGFEKQKHYLLIVFQDFETRQGEGFAEQCQHFLHLQRFIRDYQYNTAQETFLRMLQYVCRQVKDRLQIDAQTKKIFIDVGGQDIRSLELYIYTPQNEEWPVVFRPVFKRGNTKSGKKGTGDDLDEEEITSNFFIPPPQDQIQQEDDFDSNETNESRLFRHYEETDEQFLQKIRDEMKNDRDLIVVKDFERKAIKNVFGYLLVYVVRSKLQIVFNFKYLQRVKFKRIKLVEYLHTIAIKNIVEQLGAYQKSEHTREIIKDMADYFDGKWTIDRQESYLTYFDSEWDKLKVLEEQSFKMNSLKNSKQPNMTEIEIRLIPYGTLHFQAVQKMIKWWRVKFFVRAAQLDLKYKVQLEYEYFFRGLSQQDKYRLRMVIIKRKTIPTTYWAIIETLNTKKERGNDLFRLHASVELTRNITLEISQSGDPWQYFEIQYKYNKIDLKPQIYVNQEIQLWNIKFSIKVMRYMLQDKYYAQLVSNDSSTYFDCKLQIVKEEAISLQKSKNIADQIIVKIKKNVFKIVDPELKERSVKKIQTFIRYVMLRILGKRWIKEQMRIRNEAARRVQSQFRYQRWRRIVFSVNKVNKQVKLLSHKLLFHTLLAPCKAIKEMVEKRQAAARRIWLQYKYSKWRKQWMNLWKQLRDRATNTIMIFYRYKKWRKKWYKNWMDARYFKAMTRLLIYYRYRKWRKKFLESWNAKRKHAANAIIYKFRYKKWQRKWVQQWRERRQKAMIILLFHVRRWLKRRFKAASKLTKWGRRMSIKIKTRREIGYYKMLDALRRKRAEEKVHRFLRKVIARRRFRKAVGALLESEKKMRMMRYVVWIQYMVRKALRRIKARKKLQENKKLLWATIILQKYIRKYLHKKLLKYKEMCSIIKIQYCIRRFVRRQKEKKMANRKLHAAIVLKNRIKKWYRRRKRARILISRFLRKSLTKIILKRKFLSFFAGIQNQSEIDQQNQQNQQRQNQYRLLFWMYLLKNFSGKEDEKGGNQTQQSYHYNHQFKLHDAFMCLENVESAFYPKVNNGTSKEAANKGEDQKTKTTTIVPQIKKAKTHWQSVFRLLPVQQIYFVFKFWANGQSRHLDFEKYVHIAQEEGEDKKEKRTVQLKKSVKLYLAVISIQILFRVKIKPRLTKKIMVLPSEDFQLIQNVVNPLIICQRQGGFTISFTFKPLKYQKSQPQIQILKIGLVKGRTIKIGMNYDKQLSIEYFINYDKFIIYSQRKVRFNVEYHLGFVMESSQDMGYCSNMYINGVLEGQFCHDSPGIIPQEIQLINGGVDNMLIITKSLTNKEIQEVKEKKYYQLKYQFLNGFSALSYQQQLQEEEDQKKAAAAEPRQTRYGRYKTRKNQKAFPKKPINNSNKFTRSCNDFHQQIVLNNQQELLKSAKTYKLKQNLKLQQQQQGIFQASKSETIFQQQLKDSLDEKAERENSPSTLSQIIKQNRVLSTICQKIAMNYEKIAQFSQIISPPVTKGSSELPFSCLHSLIANGEITLEKEQYPFFVIESDRFLQVLNRFGNLQLVKEDLTELAKATQSLRKYKYTNDLEKEVRITGIVYNVFLKKVQMACNAQMQQLFRIDDEEENENNDEDDKKLPPVPTGWNKGKFQINITRCADCVEHKMTSWHEEVEFVEKFNECGNMVKQIFPNAEVVGNYERPNAVEQFDVYVLRGSNLSQQTKNQQKQWSQEQGREQPQDEEEKNNNNNQQNPKSDKKSNNNAQQNSKNNNNSNNIHVQDQQSNVSVSFAIEKLLVFKKQECMTSFIKAFRQRMLIMYDELCLLLADYPNYSLDLAEHQQNELKDQWKDAGAHSHPFELPQKDFGKVRYFKYNYDEKLNRSKSKKKRNASNSQGRDNNQNSSSNVKNIPAGTKMVCTNWGCGMQYEHNEQAANNECRHHSGTYQMGSSTSMWPEVWTCCRNEWQSQGCTLGRHKGIEESIFQKLCVNHGQVNPGSKKPDSVCGLQFKTTQNSGCRYHKGFFKVESPGQQAPEGKWTCCNDTNFKAEGCYTGNHKAAYWPDVEAKQYFVPIPLQNIAFCRQNRFIPYSQLAATSIAFREPKAYSPYVSPDTKKKQYLQQTENDVRICCRAGCSNKKKFTYSDNNKAKEQNKFNCCHHPGKFDLGYIKPLKMEEFMQSGEIYTSEPAWSCCRGKWDSEGCEKTYHEGPIETEISEQKVFWPDYKYLKQLFKQISYAWEKHKLKTMKLQEKEDVEAIWKDFTKGSDSISGSKLPQLCDKLNLTYILRSEDLSYHFKFIDVVKGNAEKMMINNRGEITMDKFIEWWLTPIEQYTINGF